MSRKIMEVFTEGDTDSKGMFRTWFPDAGADLRKVEDMVKDVYNAGFGGMEIAMVPQFADFDPREYGWGTAKWRGIMKTVLKTALSFPEKFKVDFTITAHWPPSLNTIDPNHPAALKEISFTYGKITSLESLPLSLPGTRTSDGDKGGEARFIFTDNFIAATVAQVKGFKDRKVILDIETMKDVSDCVSQVTDSEGTPKSTPAGIPEDETAFGAKAKLADKQYYWQIDLSRAGVTAGKGNDLKEGDWILFAYYMRGTGQTLSGREMTQFHLQLPMADRMYATDYYSTEGTDAITDYWDENLLSDRDIRTMMEQCGGAIFEDSIESSSVTSIWTNRYAKEFLSMRGYDILPYLPFIQSVRGSAMQFLSGTGRERQIIDDYFRTLNDLYLRDHIERIKKWTRTFGYLYRAQSYGGCVDTSSASVLLDVAEGESLGFGTYYDYFRNISGGVHMTGRRYISDEVLADLAKAYSINWKDIVHTLNQNWAAGVNRMIIHGMSYDREVSGNFSQWPGWHAFQDAFADPWGSRQPCWANIGKLAKYISRTQAVLQNGIPQIDIAVYKHQRSYGRGFDALLDSGYNYDVISSSHLFLDEAKVEDGRLCPDGPAYRALVVNNQERIPLEAAKKLLEFAKAGLPVIFVSQVPGKTSGAFSPHSEFKTVMDELMKLDTVLLIEDAENLVLTLEEKGIVPAARYKQKGMRAVCRKEDGEMYYFLFNGTDEAISTDLKLEGEGTPCLMNLWTGDVAQVGDYERQSDGIHMKLILDGGEAVVMALLRKPAGRKLVQPTYLDEVEIGTWNVVVESWGPGPDSSNPTVPDKRTVVFENQQLCPWNDLPITPEKLDRLGVSSMADVSGIGRYSAAFSLPSCDGAVLSVQGGNDMVVAGKVNGREIPPVDASTGKTDLGGLLHHGENTIELTTATTLINRLKYSHPIFSREGAGFPPPPPEGAIGNGRGIDEDYGIEPEVMPPFPELPKDGYKYGITSVMISPYRDDYGE